MFDNGLNSRGQKKPSCDDDRLAKITVSTNNIQKSMHGAPDKL